MTMMASIRGPVDIPARTETPPNSESTPPAAAIIAIIVTPRGRFGFDRDNDTMGYALRCADKHTGSRTRGDPIQFIRVKNGMWIKGSGLVAFSTSPHFCSSHVEISLETL